MFRRLSLAPALAVALIAAPASGAAEEGAGPTATAPPPSSVADQIEAAPIIVIPAAAQRDDRPSTND